MFSLASRKRSEILAAGDDRDRSEAVSAAEARRSGRKTLLLRLYGALPLLAGPVLELYLRHRGRAGREDPARFPERRGIASRPRPDGALIWFHAASVGESMSMARLVDRLLADRSELAILVTTGTVTSAAMVADRLGDRVIHQYIPVDRRDWVDRFLDHWRPDYAIWIESEIWPILLMAIAERGIRAALVNARMSARSDARWSRAPKTIAALLGAFELCLAQSEAEACRLRRLGARDVRYVGQLKYAAEKLPVDPAALHEINAAVGGRKIWLLASSHEGEEAIAFAVHQALSVRFPDLLTIIVPRHPKRGVALAKAAAAAGLTASLRSAGHPPRPNEAVFVVDAMGELGLWYRVAPIACIGGSLVPIGGHNPIEPAQLGCALLYGPHMFSAPEVTAELEREGAALVVADAVALAGAIARLFERPDEVAKMAERAQTVAERNRHVIDLAVAALDPLLDRATRHAAQG